MARSEYLKKYYIENREKLIEQMRIYGRKYYKEHKEGERMRKSIYQKENPHIAKKAKLKYRYNITVEDYEDMLQKQGGVCKICKLPQRSKKTLTLSVDHCHTTGRIRGLLCWNCNGALGQVKDNIQTLKAMIKYLQE